MPLGKGPIVRTPPPPNVELKRGTDATLYEAVVPWPLHDALEQLGERLGLGRSELLESLVGIAWWVADQRELGREIIARPAPEEPEELRLGWRFTQRIPVPASPAAQREQRRAAARAKSTREES